MLLRIGNTKEAVKYFQHKNVMTADGIIGPDTERKLFSNQVVKGDMWERYDHRNSIWSGKATEGSVAMANAVTWQKGIAVTPSFMDAYTGDHYFTNMPQKFGLTMCKHMRSGDYMVNFNGHKNAMEHIAGYLKKEAAVGIVEFKTTGASGGPYGGALRYGLLYDVDVSEITPNKKEYTLYVLLKDGKASGTLDILWGGSNPYDHRWWNIWFIK